MRREKGGRKERDKEGVRRETWRKTRRGTLTPLDSELIMGSLIIVSAFSPNSFPVRTQLSASSSHGVIRSPLRSRNRTGTVASNPGAKFL